MWVGTYGGGLYRFDNARNLVASYRHDPGNAASLPSDQVYVILEDRSGDVWVGTKNGGLGRFDPATGNFSSWRNLSDASSLSGNTVVALREDRKGDLWIGTEGDGLNRWRLPDRQAGRAVFDRYTRKRGLRSSTIYGIQVDGADQLWISSDAGLARFNPESETFKHYDTSHGLQGNDFNFGASFRARDGQMFFGGVNGFNAFYPSQIRGNQHVPPVILTSFSKFNAPVDFGKPLREIGEIELGYKDSVIAFEFAALDYTAPHKNRYRYRLEGFDENWVEAGTQRRATYTNLEAGSYVFRVQGSNNDGVWNTEGASVRLGVAPAPWESWWAYLIYASILAGIVALFARAQRRKREWAEKLADRNEELTLEIAQRRQKEKALEREKKKAQGYLDVAEVIMLVVDSKGTVTLVNPKGCEVLGRDADEIVGKAWIEEFVVAEGREEAESTLGPAPQAVYTEYSVRNRRGEERIVAWHTAVLSDEKGRWTGTLCSGADITDMRRLAAEKATAESATRAKSQFLANVSHEIRTPLNGVLGMIELLSNSSLNELQRRFADTAAVSAKNLMAILNDVLDFSKIEAGKLPLETVAFDLRQVVEEVGALFAESAHQKGLELLHMIPSEVPTALMGDPTRLRQILSNLVGNAIKFTSEGEVVVSVDVVSEIDEKVHLSFEVQDSGMGVDEQVTGNVFESFQQGDQSTTRRFGGTGLGLAISKQLVELLGGEIGFQSSPGSGSLFWFTLPLLRAPRDSDVSDTQARRFGSPAPRLLVVDDHAMSRAHVGALLEEWGADVVLAPEGSAALLELLEASRGSRPFDALLVDHFMKDMDGIELARAVKAQPQLSSLPVVLMASTSIPPEEEMERAGVSSYLVKPVRREELFQSLARALRFDHTPEMRPREDQPVDLLPFHVLVAEDNVVNQEVIGGMVAALGGTADFVNNGREAVDTFEVGRYDLVFMDCQMPVMDGYDASRAIREREEYSVASVASVAAPGATASQTDGKKRTPIVALTANALGDDRSRCLAAGMDNYLSKPCSLDDLRRALNTYLPSRRPGPASRPAPLAVVRSPSPDGINPEVFDKIRALAGDSGSGFVEKVVTTYLEASPPLVKKIESALLAGDSETMADAAHTLKSSSASLGAERLAALCRKIERLGRENKLEQAADVVEAARAEFDSISTTLAKDYLIKSA